VNNSARIKLHRFISLTLESLLFVLSADSRECGIASLLEFSSSLLFSVVYVLVGVVVGIKFRAVFAWLVDGSVPTNEMIGNEIDDDDDSLCVVLNQPPPTILRLNLNGL
jgi:hypothetical protein